MLMFCDAHVPVLAAKMGLFQEDSSREIRAVAKVQIGSLEPGSTGEHWRQDAGVGPRSWQSSSSRKQGWYQPWLVKVAKAIERACPARNCPV